MAALNSTLWLELIKTNKENVIDIIDCFIADLLDLKVAIMNDDDKKLLQAFKSASNRRKELE